MIENRVGYPLIAYQFYLSIVLGCNTYYQSLHVTEGGGEGYQKPGTNPFFLQFLRKKEFNPPHNNVKKSLYW